jgi:hypothetical protein
MASLPLAAFRLLETSTKADRAPLDPAGNGHRFWRAASHSQFLSFGTSWKFAKVVHNMFNSDMSFQTARPINFGQNETGKLRLRLYKQHARKRRVSLSSIAVRLLDKEFGINIPVPRTNRILKKA